MAEFLVPRIRQVPTLACAPACGCWLTGACARTRGVLCRGTGRGTPCTAALAGPGTGPCCNSHHVQGPLRPAVRDQPAAVLQSSAALLQGWDRNKAPPPSIPLPPAPPPLTPGAGGLKGAAGRRGGLQPGTCNRVPGREGARLHPLAATNTALSLPLPCTVFSIAALPCPAHSVPPALCRTFLS